MSWINRKQGILSNSYSEVGGSQRTDVGYPSTFSRADCDQNWRKKSDYVSAYQPAWLGPTWRSRNKVNLNEDKNDCEVRVFNIPRYQSIIEDESILENYRRSLRYIGDYSEDAVGNYRNEKFGFHFLKKEFRPDDDSKVKEVKIDLDIASDKAENFSAGRFENFLKWIASQHDVLSSLKADPNSRAEVKFLLTPIVLAKILQISYVRTVKMSFTAAFVSGSIYMASITTKNQSVNQTSNSKVNQTQFEENYWPTYKIDGDPVLYNWAHKYKQYMRTEDPTKGTIPNEQFRVILTSKLGPYEVLFNPPIDVVNSDLYNGERDLSAFVKLYCTSCPYTDDPSNYINSRKTFYWAIPMILEGIKEMIAGFHDEDGIISQLRLYTVEDLLMKGKDNWNLHQNFTFAVKFLDFVKEETQSSPGTIFSFQRISEDNFVICKNTGVKFGPEWFTRKLDSIS